jgi:O-antigen ligase
MNNKKINIPFLLICVLLVFAPLARGGVQGWAVASIHIITLAALTVFLVQKSLDWDWHWIRTPLDWPIVVLLGITLISTLFSSHRPSSIRAILLLLNYLAVYYLIVHLTRNPGQMKKMAWIVVCIGVLLAILGLIGFSGLQLFPWWEYRDLPDFGALTSTYGNPNNIAGFFEMAIPLVLGMLLAENKGASSLKRFVPIIILFGMTLILSLSRGGWTSAMLGLVFFVTVLAWSREFPRRKTVIGLTGSGIVLVLVLLSSFPAVKELLTIRAVIDTAGGLDGRLEVAKAVGAMILDKPFLGFGPGTFAYSFFQYQPAGIQGWYNLAHNDYAHFTAELGLLFPLVMIWMIIALLRQGFAKLQSPSLTVRSISLGSMAGIVAILCHSVVDFNLHIPANALFFTVLCALVAAPETTEVRGERF